MRRAAMLTTLLVLGTTLAPSAGQADVIVARCRSSNLVLGYSARICIDIVTMDPDPSDPGFAVMIDIYIEVCRTGNCFSEWIWEDVGLEINDEEFDPMVTPVPGGTEISLFGEDRAVTLYFQMNANPIDIPEICVSTVTVFC